MLRSSQCIALASLTLLTLGCDGRNALAPSPINASAVSTWTRSSIFTDFTVFIECLHEDVRLHGEVPFRRHDVTSASGVTVTFVQFIPVTPQTPQFFAEGLASGKVYQYQNGLPINQIFRVGPGDQAGAMVHDREVYVNVADHREKLYISASYHLTVNANGVVVIDRFEFSDFLCLSN